MNGYLNDELCRGELQLPLLDAGSPDHRQIGFGFGFRVPNRDGVLLPNPESGPDTVALNVESLTNALSSIDLVPAFKNSQSLPSKAGPWSNAAGIAMMSSLDYDSLWSSVVAEPHLRESYSVHGPDHWRRVERNACILAARTGAIIPVVRLFALFHDSRRENDHHDPDHGRRGAEFAARVRGSWFDLSDEHFERLRYACIWHTDGLHHDDPTIGTCWDADRLDLGRVGIVPHPRFMSTPFGREIAQHGTIAPWMDLARPHLPFPETHHFFS